MDFIQIATQLGVPVACMVVLAIAIWRVAIWFGSHIALPLVDAHILFLKSVEIELKKQTESYGVQSKILQEMSARIERRQPGAGLPPLDP